jgi:hypothetical protein
MLNNISNKKNFYFYFFLIFYFFHLILSISLYVIAKTDLFIDFHNGQGIWNLFPDVLSYHAQALRVTQYFIDDKIGIVEFVTNTIPDIYNNNRHIKWIGLLYYITDFREPIIYSLVNSLLWALCVIYIFKITKLIFNNNLVSLLSISYMFFPSIILSFTQAIRDPFYFLYFIFLTYSITKYSFENKINISYDKKIRTNIKLGLKFDLNIFFVFNKKKFMENFETIVILILSIIFLYSSRDYIIPILNIFLYFFFILYFIFFSINFSYQLNTMQINICLINLFTIFTIFLLIYIISSIFNNNYTTKYVKNIKQVNEIVSKRLNIVENNLSMDKLNKIKIQKKNSVKCPEIVDYNATLIEKNNMFSVDLCEKKLLNNILNNYLNEISSSILFRYNKIIIYKNILFKQIIETIQSLRNGFTTMYGDAPSSSLNTKLVFNEIGDLFNYFPAAILIGFLLPIPLNFLFNTDHFNLFNIISSIEMFTIYIMYFGFMIGAFKNYRKIFSFLPILIFSIMFILLLSYIIPYMGTLYRMRAPFYLVFYIIGIFAYVDIFYSKKK